MRKQYHFWPGEGGMDAWDVDRLIGLAADLPEEEIVLARALLDDRRAIKVKRLRELPEPDYRGCRPDELPY